MRETPLRAIHGAIDYAELASSGLSPEEILDFSVNSNPYGPSPAVQEAIRNVPLDRYPDRDALQLRQAILEYEVQDQRLPLSSLLCGNGSNELIWTIATSFLHPGEKVAIIGPTFGEYSAACRAVGATCITIRATAETQFQPDSITICHWLQKELPRIVWLCNPNNPTGSFLEANELFRIAHRCMRIGALLVIDEAYRHFVFPAEGANTHELLGKLPELPLIILRSLTKDFALAGLRSGYVLANPVLIAQLQAHLPVWNVNALAQAASIAALQDRVYLRQTLQTLEHERQNFFEALRTLQRNVVPSRTHFCLLEVEEAQRIRACLLQRKLLVRDCTSFGLPNYIRVATRPAADWQLLMQALRELL